MKLNLGCGNKHIDGFVNVDLANNWCKKQPDVVADITQRLPFDDKSADQVHSYHVIEHIDRWLVPDVLADWTRVLKPGGLMVVECPCFDKIVSILSECISAGIAVPDRLTIWGLYGDPSYRNRDMVHRWCYSISELTKLMTGVGLITTEETPKTHVAMRDMRIVGRRVTE